jgi:hypothetical protein
MAGLEEGEGSGPGEVGKGRVGWVMEKGPTGAVHKGQIGPPRGTREPGVGYVQSDSGKCMSRTGQPERPKRTEIAWVQAGSSNKSSDRVKTREK